MPTTANARRVGVGCVLAWCCFPVGAVIIVCFNASGEAAFSPEATAPAAQRRARPQAGAAPPRPGGRSPGAHDSPGAKRREGEPQGGTNGAGHHGGGAPGPEERSGRARAKPTPNPTKRLSFVGLVSFQPNKNFRFVGYRATAFSDQTNFRKKCGKPEMLGRKFGGVLRHPPMGALCFVLEKA